MFAASNIDRPNASRRPTRQDQLEALAEIARYERAGPVDTDPAHSPFGAANTTLLFVRATRGSRVDAADDDRPRGPGSRNTLNLVADRAREQPGQLATGL